MATAERLLGRNVIKITAAWNEKELIKQVPGTRWDPNMEAWTAPLSWASCITLRGIFGAALHVGDELNRWAFAERKHRVDPAMRIRMLTEWDDQMGETDDRLFGYQKVGVEFLRLAGDALLGDDMGSGKTVQALTALRDIDRESGGVFPVLVVCPNSVKRSWANEVLKWTPQFKTYVLDGSTLNKSKILAEAQKDSRAIVIVNIESMRMLSRLAPYGSIRLKRCSACDPAHGDKLLKASGCQVHPKPLNLFDFKTVIVDEAHRIKNPESQQTRASWAVMHGPTVQRRWALTGTPLANHPGDLWSIMHGVAKQDYPSKTRFIDRYCLQAWNPYGMLDIVGVHPNTRAEFFAILDPRFRRMPKSLILEQLPKKIPIQRYVDMTPKQAKAYRELEENLITVVDGQLLVAPSNLVGQTRLLQLSSSYCTIDPITGQVWLADPSPKIDELEVIMDELGDDPLVVAAQSKQLINLASKRLAKNKVPHGLITGDQSTYERDEALADFQGGKTRALLFTVAAGGTGLTMTRAGTIVFLQRSWSMIENMQAEDRVHRIGSEVHESINVIDIVARDTVEEKVQIPRLLDKQARLQEILRDIEILRAAGKDVSTLDGEFQRIMASNLGV